MRTNGKMRWRARSVFGKAPIHPTLLVLAKAGMLVSWTFLVITLARAFRSGLPWTPVQILALVALFLGLLAIACSFAALGASARVGLPQEPTQLKTAGIYRVSRNPMYVGAYFLCLASVMIRPQWFVIAVALLAIGLHHWIVLAEETFLENRFGQAWLDYKSRVRRYI